MAQTLPGPVFSFCAYVGGLAGREIGWHGPWLGASAATLGIFLPGTFLIFFIIRFWAQLKRYRVIKASLEGINAASAGLVFSAAMLMFKPMPASNLNVTVIAITFLLLQYTRTQPWMLIVAAFGVGMIF